MDAGHWNIMGEPERVHILPSFEQRCMNMCAKFCQFHQRTSMGQNIWSLHACVSIEVAQNTFCSIKREEDMWV